MKAQDIEAGAAGLSVPGIKGLHLTAGKAMEDGPCDLWDGTTNIWLQELELSQEDPFHPFLMFLGALPV